MTVLVLGAVAGLFVLYRFPPDEYTFYPQCALHAVTGWQCPGCGGLRAMHALLHGHWREAWSFNPLFLLGMTAGVVLVPVYLAEKITGRPWLPRPRGLWWVWMLVGVIFVFGLGRNLVR